MDTHSKQRSEATIGYVFGSRVSALRKRRGWSLRGLSGRLALAGRELTPAMINRIEKAAGTRAENVTVRDLLVFAVVLGVNPISLLVPLDGSGTERDEPDPGTPLVVTDEFRLQPIQARGWLAGTTPILSGPWIKDDEGEELWRIYYTEVPTAELTANREKRRRRTAPDRIQQEEETAGRGLTDAELAERLGVSEDAVRRGRGTPANLHFAGEDER